MIIGIDATMLVYAGSGVANYTLNLIKNLLLIDKKNEYRLFYSSLRRPKNFYYLDSLRKLGAKVYAHRLPPTLLRLIWGRYNFFPIEFFIGKVDLFFSSDFLRPPTLSSTKGLTTIHDLTWKIFPEYHTQDVISAHRKKLIKTIRYGDEIIVDSRSTRNDLQRLYPQIATSKIHVIYPGISESMKPINDKKKINSVVSTYLTNTHPNRKADQPPSESEGKLPTNHQSLITNHYLLYVGAIEPRKNLDLCIRLFNDLIKDKQFADFKFFIVGRAGWRKEKIFQLVKDLQLDDKVIFVGYVKDEDLPYFYSGAEMTFYLSSYEGFGLPPLESLACGTPTVAGNNSSMRETLPKEFLVNIEDRGEVLKKIKKFIKSPPRIDSKKIINDFSWLKKATEFLHLFESIK